MQNKNPARLGSELAAVLALLPLSSAALAAASDTAQLDTVLLTGSRAKDRSLLNTPVPVDVLSQEELRRAVSGDGNLAGALQALLPSFNFPRQSNSGGADHVRAAQLRGLSPDQVLVLVNGKRRHSSAIVNLESKVGKGTNPVDFNAIPISAVRRIEVLRDGAGALYGSDAIAGVINIILDDSPQGGELQAGLGAHHTRFAPTDQRLTDGQSRELSASWGRALGAGGFLRLGAEAAHRKPTNRAGADQLPPWEDATPDNLATQGRRNYAPGEPQSESLGLWFNSGLGLDSGAQAYAFGTLQQRRSAGAAYFRYPDSAANLKAVYPRGFRPQTTGSNQDLQLAAGLRGDLGPDWAYDASLNLGRNVFEYGLRGSLNTSLGAASPTRFHLGGFASRQLGLNLDLNRSLSLPGLDKPATLAVGAELRQERFRTEAGDPASYAVGPFDGPAGAQAGPGLQSGDAVSLRRQVSGLYANLSADLTSALFADLALRWDRYGDFGSATTAKLAARYSLTQDLALRGALSSNFRAPSLAQTGFSFTVTDRGEGGALSQVRTLPVNGAIARALGLPALQAEKARNASLGLTWRPAQRLSVSADAYAIRVRDRITLSERLSSPALSTLIAQDFATPGVDAINFFTNAADTRTRGLDLVGQWSQRAWGGELRWSWASSFSKTTLTGVRNTPASLAALGISQPLVGTEERNTLTDASPRQRHVLGLAWSGSAWSTQARLTRHGKATRVFDFGDGFTPSQTYAARWQLDLEAEWRLSPALSLALGGVNVGDRYPSRSELDISYFGNFPYDVLSPIGFNGAYYYAKARYKF